MTTDRKYLGYLAAYNELDSRLTEARAHRAHHVVDGFDPEFTKLEIETLAAKLALEEGQSSFNRNAPDVDALRKWLESELVAARAVFERVSEAVPDVPPLRETTPEAMALHVSSHLRRASVIASNRADDLAARNRLSLAFATVDEATKLLAAERKRRGLPSPQHVTDCSPNPSTTGDKRWTLPTSVDAVDAVLTRLEAQRHPVDNKPPSYTETQLNEARRRLASWELKQATRAAEQAELDRTKKFLKSVADAGGYGAI